MSEQQMEQAELNSINWNELITPDPKAAIKFYGDMFGWTTEDFPMSGQDYTMFKIGERAFGGVMAPPEQGIPPHWLNYVTVDDIHAAAKKAESLGAKIIAQPMQIGEAGHIAIIQDPQGATIGLHQSGEQQS